MTDAERAWITEHPVLRVAVMEGFGALEYMQGSQLSGLSVEYLNAISKELGITFSYVLTNGGSARIALLQQGKVDMISTMRSIGPTLKIQGLALTDPYHVSAAVVIARAKTPLIFDLTQLEGKRVVIAAKGPFESILKDNVKNISLIKSDSALEALRLVEEGDADAALGTETYLIPYFGSKFEGVLQLSGVISSMTSEISMAVRDDQTMLLSVLQKTLKSISLERAYRMNEHWLVASGYGAATDSNSILDDHLHEVTLAVLLLAVLLGLVHQTHRQRRRAVRSEREKAKFLAVMSHEIRSPMNAVLAAVELLSLTRLDYDQRHLSSLASSGANTLLALLDDVLDLSRLDAEQLRLELEPVDPAALAREAVALYGLRALTKGIDLILQVPDSVEYLMLDEGRVTQILHNLISNAIKFTEYGSVQVKVVVSDTDVPGLKTLDIEVVDTGIGISAHLQERLFTPYSQAEHSYKRSGGTGLGLVICRELAELMDGTLSLTSEVGEGTVMGLSLHAQLTAPPATEVGAVTQLAPAALISSEVVAPVAGEPPANLRILVVEDARANQEVLLAQLHQFGFTAALAPDAAQAVLQFQQQVFDLVLLDCDLPDKDGYTVATELRALETDHGRRRCPIIAISASTGHDHAERCFEVDMDGVLSKPIQLAKLKSTIELWCDVVVAQKQAVPPSVVSLDLHQIRESMLEDLLHLLEAVIQSNAELALHRAHRLHGAALSMGWVDLALAAQKFESLLRANIPMDEPHCCAHLREIMQQWRQVDLALSASNHER
ncbi:ATP-binding protein [Pseudomonas fluorescens]|uniref:ATP-binding protein n=1 Tax=Pseudomonas fluorescens TaxID=294 RepID=UPI00159205D8|nr:transporter substrate-binding domain-containing protein [Pseudomonas fluorescens]